MSQEKAKPVGDWAKANIAGPNAALVGIAANLAKLHRLTIEKKLADMKQHVNAECTKMNHPAATEFAEEINKLKIE